MSTEIVVLSQPEGERLAQCEATIRRGLHTFVEVGQALAEIRDSRLYRATHETFAAYLDDRWQISRTRAHQLIDAAQAVQSLQKMLPIGNISPAASVVQSLENGYNCNHSGSQAGGLFTMVNKPAGHPQPSGLFTIVNTESKARELARVPEEERVQVLEQAAAKAAEAGRKLTADDIRQAYMPTRPTRPVVRPKLQHPAHWPDITMGVDAHTESYLRMIFQSLDTIRSDSRAEAFARVEQYLKQARNKTSS